MKKNYSPNDLILNPLEKLEYSLEGERTHVGNEESLS